MPQNTDTGYSSSGSAGRGVGGEGTIVPFRPCFKTTYFASLALNKYYFAHFLLSRFTLHIFISLIFCQFPWFKFKKFSKTPESLGPLSRCQTPAIYMLASLAQRRHFCLRITLAPSFLS